MIDILKKITQPKLLFFYTFTAIGAIVYACSYIFDFENFSFEYRKVGTLLFIANLLLLLLYFAFCMLMRLKQAKNLAMGLFYFQLLGAVAFVIYFVAFMAGKDESVTFFTNLFKWWSMPIQPLCITIARITGTKLWYISGILYLIITYVTAITASAIKKDIKYEKQYAEDHKHEITS
ncbi:MAG: hypothetical protein IKJ75_00905 [Clostridia bacterium]|nr:hypothetical protein [Clostridia bacterium]